VIDWFIVLCTCTLRMRPWERTRGTGLFTRTYDIGETSVQAAPLPPLRRESELSYSGVEILREPECDGQSEASLQSASPSKQKPHRNYACPYNLALPRKYPPDLFRRAKPPSCCGHPVPHPPRADNDEKLSSLYSKVESSPILWSTATLPVGI
jgi:hypothetical protein